MRRDYTHPGLTEPNYSPDGPQTAGDGRLVFHYLLALWDWPVAVPGVWLTDRDWTAIDHIFDTVEFTAGLRSDSYET